MRTETKRLMVLLPIALLIGSATLSSIPVASAHGNVDQSFTGPINGATSIVIFAPIGQTFTPTVSNLVAVDLFFFDNAAVGATDTISVTIRANSITGPVLGFKSQLVTSVGGSFASPHIEHFDFSPSVPLVPASTHVIEVQATARFLFQWMAGTSLAFDLYTGGQAIQSGNFFPDFFRDFAFRTYFIEEIEVPIDIKPGSDPNSITMESKGTIPVAILSTPDFDATTQVDKTSLSFGRTGDEDSLAKCTKSNEDVNGDGLLDVVCHFNAQDTGFQDGDTEGILRGQTVDGTPIEGKDSVRILHG